MERSPKKNEDDESGKKSSSDGHELPPTQPLEEGMFSTHPDQARRSAIEDLQSQILAAFNRYEEIKAKEAKERPAPTPEQAGGERADAESPVWRMPDVLPPEHESEPASRPPVAEVEEDDDDDEEDDEDSPAPTTARPAWPRPVIPTIRRAERASTQAEPEEEVERSAEVPVAAEATVEHTPNAAPAESGPSLDEIIEPPAEWHFAADPAEAVPAGAGSDEAESEFAADAAEHEPSASTEWDPPYVSYVPEHDASDDAEVPDDAPSVVAHGYRPPIRNNPALLTRDFDPHPWVQGTAPPAYAEKPRPDPSFENYDNRRRIAGNFLLAVGLSAYIAHRMDKRRAKTAEKQFAELRGQNREQASAITQLTQGAEQSRREVAQLTQANVLQTDASSAPRFEASRFAAAPAAATAAAELRPVQPGEVRSVTAPAEQIAAQEQTAAQQPDLASGQRVEHSTWHNIVVDKEGHEVQGAIAYGEAFQRERRSEQMPVDSGAGAAAPQAADDFGQPAFPAPISPFPGLSSGQVPADHELTTGTSRQSDLKHRLSAHPTGQIQSTFTSPWLWLGVGLLIVAFLAAAFL
ncbi:MAG TPA: hypothetical protein VLH84_05920 [Patescibacteria group bacterium]|nr:hypothetical protein [Patescibacteria group bacterium]